MIYSTYCFLETLIIMPFYNSWAQSSTDSIRTGGQSMDMYVGSPNSYNAAKANIGDGSTGFTFNVMNQTGTDQVRNNYQVVWTNTATGIRLSHSGTLYMYTQKSENMGFCTATVWSSC